MKKYFISVLIFLNTFFLNYHLAQAKIVRLSPEIGDTIDLSENSYYNLYPVIEDFHYAVIYLINDTTSITKIRYLNNEGLVRDTVITNSADYVGNQKAYIRQINAERLENYESDDIITVTQLDGNQVVGKLLAVQDSSFIICPDTISEAGTLTFLKTYKKLNANEVESIFIDFDVSPSVNTGAFIGAIPGCISGAIIGINNQILISYEETGWIYDKKDADIYNGIAGGLIGLLVGAGIGSGIGYLLSPADETIEINSPTDLERLKEYVVQ